MDQKMIPNHNYMAIAELMKQGVVDSVISQNKDGMHVKSGINRENLFELNSNKTLETCQKCGKEYVRDF